jgi:hypothetical protein
VVASTGVAEVDVPPSALSTATITSASVSMSPKPRGRRNVARWRRPQSMAGAELARNVASWSDASTHTWSIAASSDWVAS